MDTAQTTSVTNFQIGQSVKHVSHGVGRITAITNEEYYGATLTLIHLSIGKALVKVPQNKAASLLQTLSSTGDWGQAFLILRGERVLLPHPWHKAAKKIAERLEAGTLVGVCEVIRDTAKRDEEAKISISRLQMFDVALSRLVEEYCATFEVSREEAIRVLQEHCPFSIKRSSFDQHSIETRPRRTRRKPPDEQVGDVYRETRVRVVREPKVRVPKPPREPKLKVPKPPRERKPKPPTRLQAIALLEAEVSVLRQEVARSKAELAAERTARETEVTELQAALATARDEKQRLTKLAGILKSQVTRLKKRQLVLESEVLTAVKVRAEIKRVREELFAYIAEQTGRFR